MIVKLLLELIYGLFSVLTSAIRVGATPIQALAVMAEIKGVFTSGLSLLSNYVDVDYLMILFALVLVVDTALLAYHFIMWVLRKIPLLGIS